MIDPKIFDDLAKRFTEALPSSFRQFQTDMEKNIHAALQATFNKLDLVTREEFEVQQGVLARTRAKLEELETGRTRRRWLTRPPPRPCRLASRSFSGMPSALH